VLVVSQVPAAAGQTLRKLFRLRWKNACVQPKVNDLHVAAEALMQGSSLLRVVQVQLAYAVYGGTLVCK
jgi:hypothetical protein